MYKVHKYKFHPETKRKIEKLYLLVSRNTHKSMTACYFSRICQTLHLCVFACSSGVDGEKNCNNAAFPLQCDLVKIFTQF